MIGLVFGVSMLRNQEAIESKVAKIPADQIPCREDCKAPRPRTRCWSGIPGKAAKQRPSRKSYTPAIPASAP